MYSATELVAWMVAAFILGAASRNVPSQAEAGKR